MTSVVDILVNSITIIQDGDESPVIIVNEIGVKGDKGDIGETGAQGEKGDKGDQGSEYEIVNTYAEMIDIPVTDRTIRVLVMADEQNNSGNTSEYVKHTNGVIMWQASININQL